MNRRALATGLFSFGFGLAARPAAAHHSVAMYDFTKKVSIVGEVKKYEWNNPHIFIQVVGKAQRESGPGEWSVEAGPIFYMKRMGWKRDTFKSGEKVEIIVSPAKDGGRSGLFMFARFADGRTMGDRAKTLMEQGGGRI